MIAATYSGAISVASGVFLLTAVLIVWRRDLRVTIKLLGLQGLALASIPIASGVHHEDTAPLVVGTILLVLRGIVLPFLLTRTVNLGGDLESRETTPLVNTTSSLLITAFLVMVAYGATRPFIALSPSPGTKASPAAFAVILIAMFVLASRRRAVSQAIGFLMLDNAIAATAFLITAGVPLIVELGASLDVLFAVIVLSLLTDQMRRSFGDTDLDQLKELRD